MAPTKHQPGDGPPPPATILVVDDHPTVLHSLQLLLRAKGFRVLAADSGEKARELCRLHAAEISVVVTDLMMPGMDGQETIAALRAVAPGLQFIAISGGADQREVAELKQLGVAAFLRKPFGVGDIMTALEAAQARRQSDPRAGA